MQDTCLGSLVNDMITLGVTSPTGNCPGGGNECCSDKTKMLLAKPECIDQIRAQPRFIFESRRSETRIDPNEENHFLVNRFIQLCGEAQVPTELRGTGQRKRSVNATSRIIPIHQAFQSSSGSGTVVNTDLKFGKKEQNQQMSKSKSTESLLQRTLVTATRGCAPSA